MTRLVLAAAFLLPLTAVGAEGPYELRIFWRSQDGTTDRSVETFRTAKERSARIKELRRDYYATGGLRLSALSKPVTYEARDRGRVTGSGRIAPTEAPPEPVPAEGRVRAEIQSGGPSGLTRGQTVRVTVVVSSEDGKPHWGKVGLKKALNPGAFKVSGPKPFDVSATKAQTVTFEVTRTGSGRIEMEVELKLVK